MVGQENLAGHEVQEREREAVDLVVQRELQDHHRKSKLVERDNSYYLLRSQV